MITHKKLVTINLLSLLVISLAHGIIYKNITKFEKVEEYCKKAIEKDSKKNIFFAWDVDGTLLQETSSLFFSNNIYVDRFYDELEKTEENEGKNAYINIYSNFMHNETLSSIDEKMPKFISSLQQKNNIKNIAITAIPWDTFGQIKNPKEWRFNQLKNVGIDFSQFLPSMPKISLCNKEENKVVSHFDSGILYVGTTSKDTALLLLLQALTKYIDWQPALIIFIDDKEKNVENVHATFSKDKYIDCLCLHVAFEKKMPPKLDKEIAEFQIDYFIKNKIWIPDQKAKELYNNKKP